MAPGACFFAPVALGFGTVRHTVALRSRSNADELLAAALAAGSTVEDAAKAAGVGRRTAYRRLEDAEFAARVQQLRDGLVARATGKVADAMTAAAEKLKDLLDAKAEAVQLGAARSILELGLKLREQTELATRIEALERQSREPDAEGPAGEGGGPLPGAAEAEGGAGPDGEPPAAVAP